MRTPDKVRAARCHQCKQACDREIYTHSHRYVNGAIDNKVEFCSLECMLEALFDEHCKDKVEDTIAREKKVLHAQVCFACAMRLAQFE
jgi:hypothetical protein